MGKWGLRRAYFLKIKRKFTETFHLCYNQGEVTSWREGYHEFRTVRAEIAPRNQSIRQGSQGNFFLEDLVIIFRSRKPSSSGLHGSWELDHQRCWRGSLSLLALVGGSLVFLDCHAIATDGWETRDCPSERFGPDNSDAFAQVAPLYSLDSD